ncbi:MAG TPA: hypothetical protein PKC69_11390 [Chitinophagaceae bacterium]|nr:hypothetical protein [Chitinophagaceae bacterium]
MGTPKKNIEAQTEESLKKFREKRRWQIALRRYVIDQNLSAAYAPYFGLDIQNMRSWFEYQFKPGITWESFGKNWQFDHIIPVAYFDFDKEEELKLCWNFTNLRVEHFKLNKDRGQRLDILGARAYFEELHQKTGYPVCLGLLEKINSLELSAFISTQEQQSFILRHINYLNQIKYYNAFEFELLNKGRTVEQVNAEIDFLKKLSGQG